MNLKKIILPFVVILVAIAAAVVLFQLRQPPRQQDSPFVGPLVEYVVADASDRQIVVTGTGTVEPRNEVRIATQVSGRVSTVAPQMVAGGFFNKGELLFAVEDVDYRLAIEQARANLAQAELELVRTRNLADVARREWQTLAGKDGREPDPLAAYEPQLKSAAAQQAAAAAAVAQAELNLERTRILAPFNCFIRNEQVDSGQFLSAGMMVATVTGTDLAEVIVPLPLEELAWLQVPRPGSPDRGSQARVTLQTGSRLSAWQGSIDRVLGDIDPLSRMARVVISIADPYVRDKAAGDLLDELRPGMFVEAALSGRSLAGVIAIPRGALRDNETVWVIDDESRMRVRKVEILRRERDEFLLAAGLTVGERVVLTNLSGAADGMLLRPQPQEQTQ